MNGWPQNDNVKSGHPFLFLFTHLLPIPASGESTHSSQSWFLVRVRASRSDLSTLSFSLSVLPKTLGPFRAELPFEVLLRLELRPLTRTLVH